MDELTGAIATNTLQPQGQAVWVQSTVDETGAPAASSIRVQAVCAFRYGG